MAISTKKNSKSKPSGSITEIDLKKKLDEELKKKSLQCSFQCSITADFTIRVNNFYFFGIQIIHEKNFYANEFYNKRKEYKDSFDCLFFVSLHMVRYIEKSQIKTEDEKIVDIEKYNIDDISLKVTSIIQDIVLAEEKKSSSKSNFEKVWDLIFHATEMYTKSLKLLEFVENSKEEIKKYIHVNITGDKIDIKLNDGFDTFLYSILRLYSRLNPFKESEKIRDKNGYASINRYSDIKSIFIMLNHESYRINGLPGMNDQSEGKQVFMNKIKGEYNPEFINRIFISSCTTKSDNLTMWRLYGDDSKGAMLKITIIYPEKGEEWNNDSNNFFASHVFYSNGIYQLRLFVFLEQLQQLGCHIEMNSLGVIPFFIKDVQYKDEREYRFLYLENNGNEKTIQWDLSDRYKIPYKWKKIELFKKGFSDFHVRKIVLGPNCEHKFRVKEQLKILISEKKYPKKIFSEKNVLESKIPTDTYIVGR